MLMHAQRDTVLANLSICLSITLVLYLNECMYYQTFPASDSGMTIVLGDTLLTTKRFDIQPQNFCKEE